ncbi:MAG TPA: helix-turn-helix transcriptional regulator [Kofleriaceae bacterium]|nr:helix-turn-helix transcriptional regulator [Kofleriaceae bacterium]
MRRRDPLRIVEAGYEWIEDDAAWLAGIADAAASFGVGTGIAAYSVSLSGDPHIETFVGHGTEDRFESAVRAFTEVFDRKTARQVYAPTEFVGNAHYRVRRLAKAKRTTVDELTRGKTVGAWALVGGDPRKRAVALVFPSNRKTLDPDRPFPGARVLGLCAAHLGAALRLRALAAPVGDTDDVTESVLGAGGKILHATGDAKERAHRESLVEAVVRRERARGRLRRVAADEAASLWSVLVSGRWSIVDFVDRDGKRLLLARKNPVAGPDVTALTAEERDVVWLATQGHSRKYIAYELGLSAAQVSRRLTLAQRKLRVTSRRELLRKFSGVT